MDDSASDDEGAEEQDADEEEDEECEFIEVVQAELVAEYPAYADLVGTDVCVLPAAFPGASLKTEGAIGWRAVVTDKRNVRGEAQVKVFGAYFSLHDSLRLRPVQQWADEDGGEEADGQARTRRARARR